MLYSAGHLGSAIILNELLKCPDLKIVGVIKADPMPFTKKGLKALKSHLKKVGWRFGWLLLWQRCVQGLFFLLSTLLPGKGGSLQPAWKLANSLHIPLLKCKHINDEQSASFIKECKPDLIISAYFNQILKPHIIALPAHGVLNIHPGWLPAYRGAMAYFWVLKAGEEQAGITVHWMDEGIDTGKIVARKLLTLNKGMTQQKVLALTATEGAKMVKTIVKKLGDGEVIKPVNINETEYSNYHAMPNRDDFKTYFMTNRFFRIRDTLKIIFKHK
ncbi:MAG: methionyl-tRNA formyltransferase [Pseudohongiellaceae bacterium]